MLLKARILLERTTRWLLRNRRRPLDVAATIARFAPGTATLADACSRLLGPAEAETARGTAAELAKAGVPAQLAERVALLEALVPSLDIVDVAEAAELDVVSAAEVYFGVAAFLELAWLRDRIVALPRDTRWEAMARAALRDDLYAEQAALTAEVLTSQADVAAAKDRLNAWRAENPDAVERCLQMLADIRAGGAVDLAQLSVAVREIRNLMHASASAQPAAARTSRS
jgi:glutamate dehydrogenase